MVKTIIDATLSNLTIESTKTVKLFRLNQQSKPTEPNSADLKPSSLR